MVQNALINLRQNLCYRCRSVKLSEKGRPNRDALSIVKKLEISSCSTACIPLGEVCAHRRKPLPTSALYSSFAQRCTNCWDFCELFWWQIVEIFVRRRARVDLVLDAVKASHEKRCKAKVWVCCRIRETRFNTLRLWRLSPRDTNAARTVTRRVRTQNGCFKARDQTLVRVCRRVCEGVQSLSVL